MPVPAEGYPDEYEGDFDVMRVAERPGKPTAIHANGEHGHVWIATTVPEYAGLAKEAQANKTQIRLHVERVGENFEVMRVIGRKEVAR